MGGRNSSGSGLKGRKVQVETLGLLTRLLEPREQSLLLFHLDLVGRGTGSGVSSSPAMTPPMPPDPVPPLRVGQALSAPAMWCRSRCSDSWCW